MGKVLLFRARHGSMLGVFGRVRMNLPKALKKLRIETVCTFKFMSRNRPRFRAFSVSH